VLGVSVLTTAVIVLMLWAVQSPPGSNRAIETPGSTAGPDRPPTATAPPTDTPTEPAPTTDRPTSGQVGNSEAGALTELNTLRSEARSRTTFDGHYVAQLASKYPGLVSPEEISPSGDNAFSAAEILSEHKKLQTTFGANIIMLLSTDYGKRQKVDGQALWVTFYDGGFTGPADVKAWCRTSFPQLKGKALTNACAVRTLRPGS
jgi:hypothetical protein